MDDDAKALPAGLPVAGAAYLILVQIASKGATFIANQLLLRSLSPSTLGIASQMELYVISTLYFARESIRVALQRDPVDAATSTSESTLGPESTSPSSGSTRSRTIKEHAQAAVNISYLAALIGIPLTHFLGLLFARPGQGAPSRVPMFDTSLRIMQIACILELFSEPCFAIVQQKMQYKLRAAVETAAIITKSALTCGTAIWAMANSRDLGALPFAIGQLGYAAVLLCGYGVCVRPISRMEGFALLPLAVTQRTGRYLFSLFSLPLLSLTANIYAQTVIKHFLTQGDILTLATFSSLEDQGAYALASNYGSLVARLFFQPIEESSRAMIAKLLATAGAANPDPRNVALAKSHLCDIIRIYGFASVLICAIGPPTVPFLLKILFGSQWSFPEMSGLLASYCYYVPFLAFNGITEAFVSATASHAKLRQQSAWMAACSVGFFAAAYCLLKVWGWGAAGIVWANVMSMALRIVWSSLYIKNYFRRHSNSLKITEVLPNSGTLLLGLITWALLRQAKPQPESVYLDLFKLLVPGAILVMST
ncbi:hypothetical protein AJ80_06178 [Polytolypa hystricis UAMH7299]|uniref:Man(5)GlcNAc(2)-PP-dolichol translocation protein RFT1 n=1 Tax=Polytolypa hystricis (strain UAMH7299) TaxID=1447883 RepID=A0A2B7XXN5_POLH7|nr:hypothetical protein AJ80_06178 [Polytolypa hystricis UAMH7299]